MEHSFRKRNNDETNGSEEVICDDKGNSPIHNITSSPSLQNKETPLHKQETSSSASSTSFNENVGCKLFVIFKLQIIYDFNFIAIMVTL